jgi:hypothetical protein
MQGNQVELSSSIPTIPLDLVSKEELRSIDYASVPNETNSKLCSGERGEDKECVPDLVPAQVTWNIGKWSEYLECDSSEYFNVNTGKVSEFF